ncbi:hypothetical protein GGR57DRAFT_513351 [Xylariaceae sp. FL1272]|nr:hypothetical protein GGR57DRAFT_513351 [Xylariaceae sp. FL1272]
MDQEAGHQSRVESALSDYFEPRELELLRSSANADIEEKNKLIIRLCDYVYFRRAYRSKEDGDFVPGPALPRAWDERSPNDGSGSKLRPLTEDGWKAANDLLKRPEACEGNRSTWLSDLTKERYLYHLYRAREVWAEENYDSYIEPLLAELPVDKIKNIVAIGIGSCAEIHSETDEETVITRNIAQLMVFDRIGKKIEERYPERKIEVGLSCWDYTRTESSALEEFGFKVLDSALHSHRQFTAINDSTLFAAIGVDPSDSPFHVLCHYVKPVAIIGNYCWVARTQKEIEEFLSEGDTQFPLWSEVTAEPNSSNPQKVILPGSPHDEDKHYWSPEAIRWWKENYPEQPTLRLAVFGADAGNDSDPRRWVTSRYEELRDFAYIDEGEREIREKITIWSPKDHLWVRKSS